MDLVSHLSNKESPAFVVSLSESTSESLIGGKASSLGRLMSLGIAVPDGFVVTNTAFEHFVLNEVGDEIEARDNEGHKNNAEHAPDVSSAVVRMLENTRAVRDFGQEVAALRVEKLGRGTVIVRSSAIGEDSRAGSFAGQLDSIRDVVTDQELARALIHCWASYWSRRAIFYQRARGQELRGMAVIVQRQVPSALSGVLFTRSRGIPGTDQDAMLLEYCYGDATPLVSGRVNPRRLVKNRGSSEWRLLEEATGIGDQAGIVDPGSTWLIELARLAAVVEDSFQEPQDIEWTVDDSGALWMVQSRPITATAGASSADAINVWTNANISENYPGPVSPLLYSIASEAYTHYFQNLGYAFGLRRGRVLSVQRSLTNIVGVHGARLYYNLSSIHDVLRAAPFGDRLVSYFNSFVGADTQPQPPISNGAIDQNLIDTFTQWWELIRMLLYSSWKFLTLDKRIVCFERDVDQFAERTQSELLESKNLTELGNDLSEFIHIRLNRWSNAALADAASMISYGLLKQLLDLWCSGRGTSVHNSLLRGLNRIVSSQPVVEIWRLSDDIKHDPELRQLFETTPPEEIIKELTRDNHVQSFGRFLEAFGTYLDRWGFRSSGELMLTVPSYAEAPQGLIQLLKNSVAHHQESPLDMLDRQQSVRGEETERLLESLSHERWLKGLPWPTKATVAKKIIQWTQDSIGYRERARLKQALLYSRFRQVALAIGEQFVSRKWLRIRDDVFFLSYREINSLTSGRSMFPYEIPKLISLRREELRKQSRMKVPDVITMQVGDYLQLNDGGGDVLRRDKECGDSRLRGVGACGGSVTARAAVLESVMESDRLQSGDILVARQTDPGWGPLFLLIGGLVVERGGMLSHGAILAREFGIPAILGVAGATEQIRHGKTVFLNADEGFVQVLD